MTFPTLTRAAGALSLLLAAGCGTPHQPANLEPATRGGAYQAQYRLPEGRGDAGALLRSAAMNVERCADGAGPIADDTYASVSKLSGDIPRGLGGELLSRGDLVDLRVPQDETFTGTFVVSRDGTLKLPFIAPVPAQGRTTDQVASDIRGALVGGGFYAATPAVSLLVADFAPAHVAVAGAVFEPQPVQIGGVSGDRIDSLRQAALGASTEARNLSAAIRNAGGVRPDADLARVRLTRGGTNYVLDLRGMIAGSAADDVMLLTGDQIHVPSRHCFQDDLMRPSPISPPGISLYLSNLTQPATGNAISAIGQTVREVPYGTRFMQAVVDANCVGGARATSANRSAALFSRNPVTGVSVVIERSIEDMRARADRDDYDPYLLPGDSIACYDSGMTNLAEVGRVVGTVTAGLLVPGL
ncbi:polysaccharide biosynthesis/export family protein [Roseicyclus sp. F158]|uniref:Polysaccharide biosynthesis/export family protein n=1 Tax=Tropicimonas omnivorans TaxID=3075590 RepID=A0ABU3DH37_9RHOB|nr:polysaccharide biosynthesis/export family protein [Roseicyclus sp. F158]MDT0682982.1 polysaccharide biosynthesis/export family protein [Roseicyclus sp. F158]